MPWIPKEKEIDALLAADAKRRYEYFIHRVCDTRKVWGLYSDGWASLGDGAEKLIPFWPHQAYALRFQVGDWSTFEPREIELDDFLDHWIAGMRKNGVAPAIFPVGSGKAVVVTLDDLEANLRFQLAEAYGE